MFVDFNIVFDVIQVIAGVATAGALIFAGFTFRRIRRTEQIRIAENILKDLNEMDRQLPEIVQGEDIDWSVKSWGQRYFNHLDWLCLLINKKEIREDFIKKYFTPSIIYDYENIFLKYVPTKERNDPNTYAEFKKLYKQLKDKQT